jgi:hypothetical protein
MRSIIFMPVWIRMFCAGVATVEGGETVASPFGFGFERFALGPSHTVTSLDHGKHGPASVDVSLREEERGG